MIEENPVTGDLEFYNELGEYIGTFYEAPDLIEDCFEEDWF